QYYIIFLILYLYHRLIVDKYYIKHSHQPKTPKFRKSNSDTVVLHLTEKLRNLNTMAPRSYTLIKELKKSPTDNDDNDDSERNNWK
ncbi:hypothetical protein KSS87_020040, partial [Heliosperma pusillum]